VSAAGGDSRGASRIDPRLGAGVLAALAVVATAVVYRPLPRVYFFADDFVCMLNILNRGVVRFVLEPFGGHLLFVRNTIFWVSYVFFGFDPRPYYWMAYLTHLVNVWLFFRVTRRLTDSAVLACLGAAMWGTSPLCLGTLGWYSVYGQVLVGTITLFLLDRLTARAEHPAPLPGPVALGWYLLLLAGVSCFGTGIGVALVFPVVLFLLLPATLRQWRVSLAFLSLLVVVPVMYFGFWRLYGLYFPIPMSEAIQRQLTLSRYWPILDMTRHLIAYAITGVVQGLYFQSNAYPGQASQIVTTSFLAVLLVVLVGGENPTRRRLLALASLCLGVYALVAMGRSNVYLLFNLEPAESARQARYHYVGIIPLAMAVAVMVGQLARWTRLRSVLPAVALVLWFAMMGDVFARRGLHVEQRAPIRTWVSTAQALLAQRIEAEPPGADVVFENSPPPPYVMGPMLGHAEFPGMAGIFVLTYPTNVVRGRRVEFVERVPGVLEASKDPASNRRLAGLLVAPNAAVRTRSDGRTPGRSDAPPGRPAPRDPSAPSLGLP
jgi:hypothetical protein